MAETSAQVAKRLTEMANKEFASGGTGAKTKEEAFKINPDAKKTQEGFKSNPPIVRSPSKKSSSSPSKSVPSAVPAESVMSPAPNISEPMSPAPTVQSRFQEQVVKPAEQLSNIQSQISAVSAQGKSFKLKGRELIDEGEKSNNVLKVGGGLVVSAVGSGLNVIEKAKNLDVQKVKESALDFASDFKKSAVEKGPAVAKKTISSLVYKPFSDNKEKVGETTIGVGKEVLSSVEDAGTQFGANLKQRPIETGLRTGAEFFVGDRIIKGGLRLGRAVSAGLAKTSPSFIKPVEFTSRRLSVTADGVQETIKTDTILFNVPTNNIDKSVDIIVRGGTASTAEPLSVQLSRAGMNVDAVSAQSGLIPVFGGPVPLRNVKSLDDVFFADPGTRLRTSRLGINDVGFGLDELSSSQISFSVVGSRPQIISLPSVKVSEFPKDIEKFVKRDPTGLSWTQAERDRLTNFQLQSRTEFTAPGFISRESEIVTTAPVLFPERVGVTVLGGRRIPVFSARVDDLSDSLPSNVQKFAGDVKDLSSSSQFKRVVDIKPAVGGTTFSVRDKPSSSLTFSEPKSSSSLQLQDQPSNISSPISSSSKISDFSSATTSSPSSSQRPLPASGGGSRGNSSFVPSIPPPSIVTPPSSPPSIGTPLIGRPPRQPPVRPPFIPVTPMKFSKQTPQINRQAKFELLLKPSAKQSFTATGITSTSLRDIVSKGAFKVGETAKASFAVKDDKGNIIDAEDLIRFAPRDRFVIGKTRGALVQQAKFRISSPGEKSEITLKGIQSQKNRRKK
jgi:hypothetical protein